ncbi:hypothetical protein ACFPYM_08655, partial [Methylobacterium hispanicum]
MTLRIIVDGAGHYFRRTEESGAIVVTRRGDAARQLGSRHPFWRAVDLWRSQGCRVGPDGLCLWQYPKHQRGRDASARNEAS